MVESCDWQEASVTQITPLKQKFVAVSFACAWKLIDSCAVLKKGIGLTRRCVGYCWEVASSQICNLEPCKLFLGVSIFLLYTSTSAPR